MKKWTLWLLSLALLCPLTATAAEKNTGKIAVASDEKTVTGSVGFRMGRSSFYLLFDGKGDFLEAIDNPLKGAGEKAAGRSGKSALDSLQFDEKGGMSGGVEPPSKEDRGNIWDSMTGFLRSRGITVVVAEQFGYEIIREMKERGIACVEFKGSSAEAVKKVLQAGKTLK